MLLWFSCFDDKLEVDPFAVVFLRCVQMLRRMGVKHVGYRDVAKDCLRLYAEAGYVGTHQEQVQLTKLNASPPL